MLRTDTAAETYFSGPGEMFERCRRFDWAATPLGPVDGWPVSLRTLATAVLHSRNPMLLFWGPELIQIYNDAFIPSLGPSDGPAPRHPRGLGMRASEFWSDVWDTVGPQIEGVMTAGEAVWFEDVYLPIEKGRGVLEPAWWTYSYSPALDDRGAIGGTLVVCLETTSAVQARHAIEFERRRFRDLFRHAPAFMCVVRGPEFVFELTNERYQRLIGDRDVIGRPAREVLPELVEQGYFELLERVRVTGEPFVGNALPVELRDADGGIQKRYLSFVYQAIVEPDGSHSGVFVHGVDVTELIEARENAERANRAKGDFLAMMSHELRTPLNAIDGYAELLTLGVSGELTPEQREHVERIRRSERHLLGLINELLTYTRIEAGSVAFALQPVALDDVVAGCDALTAPQRQARGLEFRCSGCPDDVRALADPDRLRQIVLNLLSNAIKFTEPGGTISVDCGADDDFVMLRVTDTGRGIDAAQMERIFEPFVQVDALLTRGNEGVGLGLAISRDLARGMNGELTAQSRPGVGSTFQLTLPRAR